MKVKSSKRRRGRNSIVGVSPGRDSGLSEVFSLVRFKRRCTSTQKQKTTRFLAESISELHRACRLFIVFVDSEMDNYDDDLELFTRLDIILTDYAYQMRRFEEAERRFESWVSGYEKTKDVRLRKVDWVNVAQTTERRFRKKLLSLGEQDKYYMAFHPFGPELTEGSISVDIGEIYADLSNVNIAVKTLQELSGPNLSTIRKALKTIENTFLDHTVRHLLNLQKVVRCASGQGC